MVPASYTPDMPWIEPNSGLCATHDTNPFQSGLARFSYHGRYGGSKLGLQNTDGIMDSSLRTVPRVSQE